MARPLRVLLVEDNPDDAELVLLELRRAGYTPDWRRVDTEPEYLRQLHPGLDIILSDYSMPSFDGPRALELLRHRGLDIPFILVSGTVGEDVAVEAMKRGATDYLLKDRTARLGGAVDRALEKKRLLSEFKRAEMSLSLFRMLVDRSSDGIEVLDPDTGRFLDVNSTTCLRLGYTRDELLSMRVSDIETTAVDAASWQRMVDDLRLSGSKPVEGTHRRKDGSTFPVEVNVRYVRLDRDYLIASVRDNTERKRSDERLREQASLLNRARDAIVVRDLEHHVTYWNKGAERLYGWTAEEAIGQKISRLLYRDTTMFEEATANVVRQGEWHGEIQQHSKSGGALLVEARWTLVSDDAGRPKSILAINTDITEKKKLEQQFLRAQRLESIGTLAGGIAHDLNNVLAPILMSIELLRLTSQDERARSMLATIEASAQRGADMVRQILSFARGADGRRVLMDPRHIIKDIQHLIQETFPKNIRFQCDFARDLPLIVGDHTQVHQVLLNLCVNARDSMTNGGMLTLTASGVIVDEFKAAMHPHAKAGPHVLIKVADTGTGIPPEVIDKIFDPFFTTKEVGKGTGLGLSTALAIVKSHGGFLEVDSESGHGAIFSIYFPSQAPIEESKAAAEESVFPQGRGELILIVDDEAAVRTITSQTLEAFGYRAMVAADGTEALSLYTEHQSEVAAVITDLMMPVMDGAVTIQVMQRINPDVKVIAGSGLATNGPASRMSDLGVKHFLPKPYTAQAVLTALHELLHKDA